MAAEQQTVSPQRSLGLVMVGALLGAMAGFLYAAGAGITLDGHDHATDHATDHGPAHHAAAPDATAKTHKHDHEETVEIGTANASLDLILHPDSISGYNLELVTTGFDFAPSRSGLDHQPGEGHAHLYVDGHKVGRLYGHWHHLGGLTAGAHEIRVTLNANDHRLLAVEGRGLAATRTVNVD